MPKVRTDISDLNMYSRSTRIEEKYPWLDKVQDGKVHELVKGKDFTVQTETMRQSMKLWAERNGIGMAVKTEGENILVQSTNQAPSRRKPRKAAKRKR